ncbi:MAG: hypothetical protein K5829_05120 [Treponema sp.]|nr:hypothetical protein [Treponema sp.]
MKKIIGLMIAGAMTISAFSFDIFSIMPVSKGVKNTTQTDYAISSKFGTYYRVPDSKLVRIYDSNGREIELSELTPRDSLINRTINNYDAYGNLVEQATYDSKSNLIWKNVISYKDGKKYDSSEFGKDNTLKSRTIYTYTGNTIDESGYDGDGALIWKTIYKYSDDNKLETITQYSADGSLDEEKTYKYGADGRLENITTFENFSRTSSQEVFRYAANGLLSEITSYDSNKTISQRVVIKTDATGNITKITTYKIAEKFGTTVNELVAQVEYAYQYEGSPTLTPAPEQLPLGDEK